MQRYDAIVTFATNSTHVKSLFDLKKPAAEKKSAAELEKLKWHT